MERSEIKKQLVNAGITQSEIARKAGVSKVFVNKVINGEKAGYKVRKIIAEVLGKSVEEVWGAGGSIRDNFNDGVENSQGNLKRVVDIFQKEKEANNENLQENNTKPEPIIIPAFHYYKFNKDYLEKKSTATFYKKIKSDADRLVGIEFRGKRKRYYMKVDDPDEIEKIIFSTNCFNGLKREFVSAYIRIPKDLKIAAEGIGSPQAFRYRSFFNFLSEKNQSYLSTKIEFKKLEYERKKMKFLKRDYQKLIEIARNNQLSIGKVIEITLRNFMAFNYRENPTESGVEAVESINQGGFYEDMLLTS